MSISISWRRPSILPLLSCSSFVPNVSNRSSEGIVVLATSCQNRHRGHFLVRRRRTTRSSTDGEQKQKQARRGVTKHSVSTVVCFSFVDHTHSSHISFIFRLFVHRGLPVFHHLHLHLHFIWNHSTYTAVSFDSNTLFAPNSGKKRGGQHSTWHLLFFSH